jgi:HlyD family secretion protein
MRRLVPSPWIVLLALLAAGACTEKGGEGRRYSGTIEAVEVDVIPEISGRIVSRPVDEGDRVQRGDLIAEIDAEPYRITLASTEAGLAEAKARLALLTSGYRQEEISQAAGELAEARAQLELARTQQKRIDSLVSQHVASEDQGDVARRDIEVAQARLAAAQARYDLLFTGYRTEEIDQARAEVARLEAEADRGRLDVARTRVVSPLDGTVTEKLQEPGEYARPGSPIVTVADLTNLYTWVYLSTLEVPEVRLGESATVYVDAFADREFPGRIVFISQEAEFTPKNVQTVDDRVQLVFAVKVAVANPDGVLKAGLPADVAFRPAHSP